MKKQLIAIAVLLIGVGAAAAQNLGGVITVTAAAEAQQFPGVAFNSTDNTYLVVWEHVVDPTVVEVHGVILDGETGQPIGGPVLLLAEGDKIEAPEVVYNSAENEFLLVARRENDSMALAQRVSANGQPIGGVESLGRSEGPTYFDPASRARVVSAAYNATDNQYLVALCGPPSGQILFPDLTLDIIVEAYGDGTNPAAAWSSRSNAYLTAWEDREIRNTGSENLSAQLLSAGGEPIGDTLKIRDQDFAEESPRIAYNPDDDQFLVIWDERIGFSEGLDPQTLTDTIGQIVDAAGKTIGNPIPIEAGTAYTLRQDVDYSSKAGMYLIVWKGDESGDFAFADIYGRTVGRDGSPNGDAFLIYDAGDDGTNKGNDEQYYDESKLPVVAANTNHGGFLVVWEEAGTNREPLDRNILARFVTLPTVETSLWELMD